MTMTNDTVTVKILDTTFDVEPQYYHESIGTLIEEAINRQKESHLVEYLKQKYSGFNGVPVHLVNDELLLDNQNQVDNFLRIHFERKWNKIEFVPFELVADHVLYYKEAA